MVQFYTFSSKNLLQTFVVSSPLSVHLPQDNNFVEMERAWTAQRSKNTTHLCMQLDATIDESMTSSRFLSNASDFHWVQRPKCPFILCEAHCWLFILREKMFTVSESRPLLLMKILYNSVKRLRDGFASRHLSALSAIYILQMR